jgi:predicted transcriptional regulator
MNKVVRKIQISAELDAAIEQMARDTHRTPSEVVTEAVEQMFSDLDDLAVDLERWAEYERTGESIDAEDMRRLLEEMKQHRRPTKR